MIVRAPPCDMQEQMFRVLSQRSLGFKGMYLLQHPESGKIVSGSGGVRKLRWAVRGKGKSGGIQVIYYWKVSDDEIWLLTVYGKSERETIAAHIMKQIAEEIKDG